MREILFRGKRTDNGEWIEFTPLGALFANPLNIEVELKTVGIYTGLTDRNGKKIFEGDIIHIKEFNLKTTQYNDHNYEIVFKRGCFMLEKQGRSNNIVEVWRNFGEVIGNIHDNPELLK